MAVMLYQGRKIPITVADEPAIPDYLPGSHPRTCQFCQTEFLSKTESKMYCSSSCRRNGMARRWGPRRKWRGR
jgi:hypothetical protein